MEICKAVRAVSVLRVGEPGGPGICSFCFMDFVMSDLKQ